MQRSRMLLALMAGIIAISPGCGGCSARQEQASEADGTAGKRPSLRPNLEPSPGEVTEVPDGSVSAFLAEQALLPPELQSYLIVGEADDTNRYPSTVEVYPLSPPGESRYRGCAGVLLTPQLVLTAGQCVCRRHPVSGSGREKTTRIDASDCASAATVVTHTYERLTDREGVESWVVKYEGAVRPHPRFELQLNEQGITTVHHADLAVIRLDAPVQKNIPPVRLAEKGAQVGEHLTVVGYGFIEAIGGMDGERRFTREQVLKLLAPDGQSVSFGSPELHSYKGDTGGPCLRETAQGPELLGISSRGLGREAAFTSIPHFRMWLNEEILLAQRERSISPLAPEEQKDSTP